VRWRVPWLLLVAPLAACHGHASHPVFDSATAPPPLAPFRPPSPPHPEPSTPTGRAAAEAFYRGFADVEGPIAALRTRGTPAGARPVLVELEDVEQGVRRRGPRRGPLGELRHVGAYGFAAFFPLPPRRAADLLASPSAERFALGAHTFRVERVEAHGAGVVRRRYRVELLGMGEGPFRFDFRFTTAIERWDLPDGVVLLRYDPLPDPPPEHVTLFRGAAVVRPVEGGSEVTEFLVLGTDVGIPFFLEGRLRGLTRDLFQARVSRLHEIAVRAARR
jgi:hypothetical protein